MASILLALLLAPLPQGPADPGPHLVGIRDLDAVDQRFGQGAVDCRIYYPATVAGFDTPADPSGGPYDTVNMMHGFLGSADGLDDLSSHIASWGFVVISTDTNRGFFPDTADYARDSRALLWWVEDQAQDPQSFLSGMVDPGGDWAAVGHSMGGGTLGELVGIESRVRTIIGLQAADNRIGEANIDLYDGSSYWIAGSVDFIVRPSTVRDWYVQAADRGLRDTYFLVEGMGHTGPLDNPPNNEPLPGAEQAREHRRLVGGLIRMEIRDEYELAEELFSESIPGDPTSRECANFDPVVWARPDAPGTTLIALGGAGRQFGGMAFAWSPAPAQQSTRFGLLGIDAAQALQVAQGPGGSSGVLEPPAVVAAGSSGTTLYVTAIAIGAGRSARLGNTVAVAVP